MEVGGQLHTLATLPWGQSPWYLLDRSLGGPQSWSGCGAEEKIVPSPARNKTPIIQTVA